MHKSNTIKKEIRDKGLLPLFYHNDASISLEILKALYAAGIRAVEYTNRGENALKNFRQLKTATTGMPGLYLGIGTIKNADQAKQFIDAGADFIISPGIPPSIAQVTQEQDILYIPGCMTPTEIILAESFFISFIKLFPGYLLGPSYLKAVRELFPEMEFMPTGGVGQTADNIKEWFAAGVAAIGMGSNLITKTALESGNYDMIKENTLKALSDISFSRKKT